MNPKRYKLLKDLPGCPASGEPKFFTECALNGVCLNTRHYRATWPEGVGVGVVEQPASVVENNPDFFSAEPERPYPFEPEYMDCSWYPLRLTSKRPEDDWDAFNVYRKANAIYRTKEDAELALKGLPLYNKAVQALCNKRGWKPKRGDDAWYVGGSVADDHYVAKTVVRGDGVDPDDFPSSEDAQAVLDLIHFFIPPPYAE